MLFVMRFKNIVFQTFLYLNKMDLEKQLTTYFLKNLYLMLITRELLG